MNPVYRGILTLIKSAVTGESYPLPEGFSLNDAGKLIRKQGIACLCYTGALRCGIPESEPVMQALQQMYMQEYVQSERQLYDIQRMYDAFEAYEVDYMPVKGCLHKYAYPSPELRPMGDADILIRTAQYDRVREAMKSIGFTEGYESDHELVWESPSLMVELHKHLIPSYFRDYYRYFGDGWKMAARQEGHRFAMTEESAFVYDFTHFTKHFRDGGCGCRMVADLWVWRRSHPQMQEDVIRKAIEKIGLTEFYGNICRVLDNWFGDAPDDEITELVTEKIFAGGVFGTSQQHFVAEVVRAVQESGNKHGGKWSHFFSCVFLTRQAMDLAYPKYRKLPLPVAWVCRCVMVLLFRRNNLTKVQEETQAIDETQVKAYADELARVGLKFSK